MLFLEVKYTLHSLKVIYYKKNKLAKLPLTKKEKKRWNVANPDELREIWNELMAVNGKWFASQSYRSCSFPMMTWSIRSHLAAAILLGTAVTEERAVFGIGDLMVFVTDLGTHCAHTYPIHHLTGVTVIPVRGRASD